MDAITNLIKKLGLTKILEKEYNKYIIRTVLKHECLVKSKAKYEQLYTKRFSKYQRDILNRWK